MKEQVIELAKQAGCAPEDGQSGFWVAQTEDLIRFDVLVRNAALEEAAKRFDDLNLYGTKTADTKGVAVILRNLKEPTP